jgi:anion-transporting  ArsA/GET3 family ATPase
VSGALLERRLLVVSGKGGVGKSTVAAVLALVAARRGARVRLVAVGAPPPELPGVVGAQVDGRTALDEYLGGVLPGPLHRRLVRSGVYRRLTTGAPGLFDLMLLGKIADDARGGAWDLVVADIGATGHALQMLAMPAAAIEAFGAGRVRREATRIVAELADPGHTGLVAVTIPEELAIDELHELTAGAARARIAAGTVIINRLHSCPCAVDDLPAPNGAGPPLFAELLRRGRAQAARAELDRRALARLGPLGTHAVRLPELIGVEDEAARLQRLVAAAEECV